MRLTKERLEEIRLAVSTSDFSLLKFTRSENIITEMLAEIDALEVENIELQDDVETLTEQVDIYERQGARDRLEHAADLERRVAKLREACKQGIKIEFMWTQVSDILDQALMADDDMGKS